MTKGKYDFGGYATKNNLKCTDGRVILKDAFKDNDGATVPLVWQHTHNEPANVLGHALLENREDGVYAYCRLNSSDAGKNAKLLVEHGDITALSIYANDLVEKSKAVAHGVIREVSLVLAGANPGALIDNLSISHSDGSITDLEDEAIIYTGSPLETESIEEEVKHADEKTDEDDETVGDVFDTLNEKQKTAVYAIIADVIKDESEEEESEEKEEAEHSNLNEGDKGIMKKNVFDGSATAKEKFALTHDQFSSILSAAQKCGSLKEAFLAHEAVQEYGIENIDFLFPDARTLSNEPSLIKRDTEWVSGVINGTHHTPFSRIKSIHADLTAEEARALGYITGNLKKEEVIRLLRRITTPTTIYKKQKLDRDDIVDITDLDVVSWLKREMRMMLDEELARAVLVSDGRPVESLDKINEENIRPIWKDADMYAHKVLVPPQDLIEPDLYGDIMDTVVRARQYYKGSGTPSFYTTPAVVTELLLQKDGEGRRIYETEASLAAALRVAKIVEVPVMENLIREQVEPVPMLLGLVGIVVNLRDYTLGADKGGAVNMFDDFDIDYNQYKYLIETRCSGALTLPKSALIIERDVTGAGPE
jgi:hypothetical protein